MFYEKADVPEAAKSGFGKHLILSPRVRQAEKRTEILIKTVE
jgi:hypothetical protein